MTILRDTNCAEEKANPDKPGSEITIHEALEKKQAFTERTRKLQVTWL